MQQVDEESFIKFLVREYKWEEQHDGKRMVKEPLVPSMA